MRLLCGAAERPILEIDRWPCLSPWHDPGTHERGWGNGWLAGTECSRPAPPARRRAYGLPPRLSVGRRVSGFRPPVAELHEAWRGLGYSIERRHLRECLAMLEASIATAADEEAWPILAAARREIDLIRPGSRITRLAFVWLVFNVVAVLLPVWYLPSAILGGGR